MKVALFVCLVFPLAGGVFPPGVTSADVPRLMQSTAWVRSLDEAAVRKLVPERSGLYFVGCPNCENGKQEDQLAWTNARPGEVYCKYCQHRYPSDRYPMTGFQAVRNPRGEEQTYRYWANQAGYRFYFEARRDDLVRVYLADRARELAQLYAVTGDRAFALRAAVILDRFAEVFPGWCYHYDYPFQQMVIYDGDVAPEMFRAGYRTARWTWWAYSDIPTPLVQAYDWIRSSGALEEVSTNAAGRIERDLLRNAGEQVLANPEAFSNMSPSMWTSVIRLGRVISEPRYVHEPARRLRAFVDTRFFYDGVWPEGAPSYHAQTVGNLEGVLSILKGYSDPADYTDPVDGEHFDNLDLAQSYPSLVRSNQALLQMRLPNGRFVPVHDTWSTDKRTALEETRPYLLPALGHACLGGGGGEAQTQFHLTWSGGYGHQHGDNLSLLVFGQSREMLSDLGYTHTRQRAWTVATAAHNTVVIDGRNQYTGSEKAPSDGVLRWFDASSDRVQSVSAGGERAYPGVATLYRRTVTVVEVGQGRRYAVDVFEVEGGRTHDYFLHGDADGPGAAAAPLALAPVATLLPEGFDWRPAQNEGEVSLSSRQHWAYGYLRNLRAAAAPAGEPLAVTFSAPGGAGVRVTLLPEPDSRLFLGDNPAVRGAREDDGKLDDFSRPFLMLRHEGGRSVFAAVIEPFSGAPFIDSVERAGQRAVRVTASGRTEVIAFDRDVIAHSPVLAGIGPDGMLLSGGALPAAGDVIRLVTGDGWVYPFTVSGAERSGSGVRVGTLEGPGMMFDSDTGRLYLSAYPQREHPGPIRVDWPARPQP